MSDQAAEETPPILDLPPQGDAAFTALMDILVPEETGEEGAEGGAAGDAAAGDAGGAAPGAASPEAKPAAEPGDAAAPGAGADGAGADAGTGGEAAPVGGGGDLPATWTASSAELIPKLGELTTALEDRTAKAYQAAALDEVKVEYQQYFEAIEKHPRLLVGQDVPALDGSDGTERITNTADAKEWQEAVKSILVDDIRSRASKQMDENSDFLGTLHASIELFTANKDMVPGTKEFDIELANRFADFAEPYELRVEGKLQGYSIPVQPIVDRLRAQLVTERSTSSTASPATEAGASAPAAGAEASTPSTPAAPGDAPQAGIPSKAGSGENSEDFSTLFGTIGLPNLQI